MRWSTAVRRIEEIADECARMAAQPAAIFRLRVTEAWLHGPLLDPPVEELTDATVPLRVALVHEDRVEGDAGPAAWGTLPPGAGQWLAASRLPRWQVRTRFRAVGSPVANHEIVAPLRFWTLDAGLDEAVVAALRSGRAEEVARRREPEPAPGEALAAVEAELARSLHRMGELSAARERHRHEPGQEKRLEELADVVAGYLDLRHARERVGRG
ncbi:hypothetical protein ACFFKU_18300 [Kineococcus gynurae]|uniref:DUF7711 domain-containing protein n=1 Tax=Kineococcus gynurae TaxID=452979 RepID=A0ABV5LNA5_9ACTN